MVTKLDRLIAIRERIVGDFDHHLIEIAKFNDETNNQLMSFRSIALEKTFKEFSDINEELEKISTFVEREDRTTILNKNRDIEDKYLNVRFDLDQKLQSNETSLNISFFPTAPRNYGEERTNVTEPNMKSCGIKLANIHLTPFEGKPERWAEFKDTFLSLMKKYRGDGAEKLTHLKNYLRGEAKEVINHLNIRNDNYDIAWELLTSHYDNKWAIFDAHMRNFTTIPLITNATPSSIRYAITTTRSCLAAINNLGILVDTWDSIIVFLLREKFSPEIRTKWEEEHKGSHEIPTLKNVLEFLEIRHRIGTTWTERKPLTHAIGRPKQIRAFHINEEKCDENLIENKPKENLVDQKFDENPIEEKPQNNSVDQKLGEDDIDAFILFNTRQEQCSLCDERHRVFMCPKLKTDAVTALQLVKNKQLCTNCLYKHKTEVCLSKHRCRICQGLHNSLLHAAFLPETNTISGNEQIMHVCTKAKGKLLATALIPIQTMYGEIILRALIDQGSTTNLISEKGAQLIRCKRNKIPPVPMIGLNNIKTSSASFETSFIIGSLHDKMFKMSIDAYITRNITVINPSRASASVNWAHLQGLKLADPSYMESGTVDILIGTVTFAEIIQYGLKKGQINEPIAQNTKLGWIISGAYHTQSENNYLNLNTPHENYIKIFNINTELSDQMKAFWEIEELSQKKEWSDEDKACEAFFIKTITRAKDGKLIMKLPFKKSPCSPDFLGESLKTSERRFAQLERQFARNPQFQDDYTKCINEYIQLGHAVKVPMEQHCHVIPHHAVIKESSSTTKLRVVFNASAKTSNGQSLNSQLYVGPTILESLWSVLLRWRLKRIAITSDIEKMYRMFWVHPEDAKYQQILWRTDPKGPIELFELRTVTFGTAPAPYMAIRGLHYIADSVESIKPKVTNTIKRNFYVDDWLDSFDTIEEALELKTHLTNTLSSYGLNLRKWNSNATELTQNQVVDINLTPPNICTALGLKWNTTNDHLSYKINIKPPVTKLTKRSALSEIASLFDPLGLLSPLIMRAKAFMQQLWLCQYDWDDELTPELKHEWNAIRLSFSSCTNIKIPRWIGYAKHNKNVSLHGFCDASEKAYAAVLYLRTEYNDDTIEVQLVTSKSKVTPLKKLSIPRLELCAALLLSKLMNEFQKSIEIPKLEIYAWTDSAITYGWIATPPYQLKTFVGQRVSEIQQIVKPSLWRHVKSTINPADYATRCQFSTEIASLTRWWNGPLFLSQPKDQWPKVPENMISKRNLPEIRPQIMIQQDGKLSSESEFLLAYSSLTKLLNITACCTRWLKKNERFRQSLVRSAEELNEAKMYWIRYIQNIHYVQEINCLNGNKPLHNRSTLLALSPFLDRNNILRVRGRLRNSLLPLSGKYPIILPINSHFTKLIIQQAHFKALHGGLQITLRTIREEFWIVRGKVAVKQQLKKCITCFRDRPQLAQQQMGDLLAPQVQPNRPFTFTGVDFAGPFDVKVSTKRNSGTTKCYISLFICLTTKAIHLELAHNLSTEAFLSALNRFVSRRGLPKEMFSDRGTNFMGAANEMPKLLSQTMTTQSQIIQQECANQGITWHFNPARASHFGGLWEAGVKSAKTHLHRVIKDTKLSYEEFNTIITQIEACLNSRPLHSISDDIENLDVLTAGHFLIGQPLIALPHPDLRHISRSRLSRFQFMQQMVQEFWTNWSNEYLNELIKRPKWKKAQSNLQVGHIVIIKEDNVPTSQWILGRVMKTFPGKDGLVRAVEVKCKNSIVSRPIHKLCLLPIEDNEEKMNDKIN